jgi:hypothetical protein
MAYLQWNSQADLSFCLSLSLSLSLSLRRVPPLEKL